MPASLPQLAVVCATVALGSVVQGTVGFASGLLVIPILFFAGWSLPEAIAINLVAGVAQNLYGAYQLRESIQWRAWMRPLGVRLAALPAGVWALTYADQLEPVVVRQIIGAIILAIVAAFWLWRVKSRDELHVGWELLAMTTSGFFAGFCGMGGPQMVLWLAAQRWSSMQARAFLFFAFASTLVPHAALLVWGFDEKAVTALAVGLVALPAALAGVAAGLVVGNRLPRELLRRMMLGVLALVAVSAIVMPLL